MRKLVFIGDEAFAGPHGYADLLIGHIFLTNPMANVNTSLYWKEGFGFQELLKETPNHIIGKAPELVVLGLGYSDVLSSKDLEEILTDLQGILALALQKTQARLYLSTLCIAFLADDPILREKTSAFNRSLPALIGERVQLLDPNTWTMDFLNRHRHSAGEKHALHFKWNKLTSLGRLFMAHHAYKAIIWPE